MLIYAVKSVPIIEDVIFNRLLTYVEPSKQVKVRRFLRREDAQRSLFADLLIRSAICDQLKIANDTIEFTFNKYGKPSLEGYDDFHFNLSHSGDWVVCVTDESPVGIDVERIKPIEFDIAKRFFSKQEHQDLMLKSEEHRLQYFYDLWTLKESYIKAAGMGLSLPLESFAVRVCNDGISLNTENEFKECSFKQYYIDNGYKLSVCAVSKTFAHHIIFRSVEELENVIKNSSEENI